MNHQQPVVADRGEVAVVLTSDNMYQVFVFPVDSNNSESYGPLTRMEKDLFVDRLVKSGHRLVIRRT